MKKLTLEQKFILLTKQYGLEQVLESLYDLGSNNPNSTFNPDSDIEMITESLTEEQEFWDDVYFDEDQRIMSKKDNIEIMSHFNSKRNTK